MSDDASSSSDITCYDRFGDESDTRFPCSLDGSLTQCCRKNQVCASNGLCLSDESDEKQFLPYAVEACTDRRWRSSGCVSACLDLGVGVDNCPGLGDDVFCCYGTKGCNCSSLNNEGIFRRESASGVVSLNPSGLLPASETPSSTSSSAEETSTTDSSYSSPTTDNADAATSSSAVETESSESSDSDSPSPLALGVGLGVGIPLVIIIAVLAFCLHRRRRRNHADKNLPAVSEIDHGVSPYGSDASAYNHMQHAGGYGYGGEPLAQNYGSPAELGGVVQSVELPAPGQADRGPMDHYAPNQQYGYGQSPGTSTSSPDSSGMHVSPAPSRAPPYGHDRSGYQGHHYPAQPHELPER